VYGELGGEFCRAGFEDYDCFVCEGEVGAWEGCVRLGWCFGWEGGVGVDV
jgi:hypothetical protein